MYKTRILYWNLLNGDIPIQRKQCKYKTLFFCNILFLHAFDVTYSLRTLVCKWSGSLYEQLLRLWIMMMRLWFMMLCYVIMYRQVLLTGSSWVCRTLDRMRMSMASMDFLGIRIKSQRGLFMVFIFLLLHMWHMIDIMMCLWIVDMFRWWMQADDSLIIKLTFGVKGLCTTPKDIEGEVWQQPCHSLLALMSWLEL